MRSNLFALFGSDLLLLHLGKSVCGLCTPGVLSLPCLHKQLLHCPSLWVLQLQVWFAHPRPHVSAALRCYSAGALAVMDLPRADPSCLGAMLCQVLPLSEPCIPIVPQTLERDEHLRRLSEKQSGIWGYLTQLLSSRETAGLGLEVLVPGRAGQETLSCWGEAGGDLCAVISSLPSALPSLEDVHSPSPGVARAEWGSSCCWGPAALDEG